jgi:protein disulfide-isomerase
MAAGANTMGFSLDARLAVASACQEAAGAGKRVAVVFGAEWCPDCDAFAQALGHRLVRPIVDAGFVVVKVSVGNRDKNLDVMGDFGMQVENGIPAVAILDPDGSVVKAQSDGEFRNAHSLLSVAEIVSFFHAWAPKA